MYDIWKHYITSNCVLDMKAGFKNYQLGRVYVGKTIYLQAQYCIGSKKVIPFALRLGQNWHKSTSNILWFRQDTLFPHCT